MRYLSVILAASLMIAAAAGFSNPANAHGKEVVVTVTSLIADPAQPLTRLYRAAVEYEDGDPVEDARIELTGVRQEGGQTIGPVTFYPLGEPGLYAAEFTYERFGTWELTVIVLAPGEGTATFTDAVLPGANTSSAATAPDTTATTAEKLAVLFKFDAQDFLNIILRFVHSLAGVAWFGLIAVAVVARRFMTPESQYQTLLRLRGIFPKGAGISLTILLASGIYNAIWDAPIRAPGVFNLQTMLGIPFGDAYMIAFLGKVLAYVAIVIVTIRLRSALQALSPQPGADAPTQTQRITRLSLFGLGTGVFLAIDISILIYMHYISHLSTVIS